MRIAAWLGVGMLGAVTALACSSSHAGGGGNESAAAAAAACYDQMSGGVGSQACGACLAQQCGAQQSALLSQCASDIQCLCPDGVYLDGLESECFLSADGQSCFNALVDELSVCTACEDACPVANLPDGGLPHDGGHDAPAGDAALTTVSCLFYSDDDCTQAQVPASEAQTAETDCVQNQHGVAGTGCPTQGLDGCCTDPSSKIETCFYGGDAAPDAASDEASCTSSGGAWQTSP